MSEPRTQRLFAALDDVPMEPDPQFIAQLRRTVHHVAASEPGSSIDNVMGTSPQPSPSPASGIVVLDEATDLRESLDASVDGAVASAEAETDERRGDDLTVDYLQHRPDESTAPTERKRWLGAVVAVAAAILVVVGVVVVADGDDSEVTTEPVSSPTVTDPPISSPGVAEPVVPPSVFDPVSSHRWSLVAVGCCYGGASPLGGPMWGVTVGGPGLVAVGSDGSGDGDKAAVWTSVDGITWSRVPHDEAVLGGGGMHDVTVGGPGLVAVGYGGRLAVGTDAAVWTSVDGVTWSRLPHDEAVFGGVQNQEMRSVTVGGPGLVAVGSVDADSDPIVGREVDPDAAVWTSVDGITWSRVPHDEAVFGGPEAWMNSVTAGGPGLVAVGGSDSGAAVWTSVDGITWSRVPHDAVFEGAGMTSVTVGGPGLVAVGGDGDAVVWTSVDGITWSRVPHDEAVFGGPGDQEPGTVIVGGPGLVAIGMEGYCDTPGCETSPYGYVPVIWTSVDGITWARVPHDEAVFGDEYTDLTLWSATAGGPGLVAVGTGGVIVAERVATPEN